MLAEGSVVEGYRIAGVLGTGGFGVTYLAHDPKLDVPVAIKEFLPQELARHDGGTVRPLSERHRPDFERYLEKFLNEAQHLASIRHPNVVGIRQYFRALGTAYLVMDYEDGGDLETWLTTHPQPPEEAVIRRLLEPLLDGLTAVHTAGVVHRDLKPSNILIRAADGSPVLIDFGAARRADATHFTAVLTQGYAPVEQYEEAARQGPWTDIYGLAAVLYRMVTGSKPPPSLLRAARDSLVPAASAGSGKCGGWLLRGIDWGLAVQPADRPQSVAAWRAVILRVEGHADAWSAVPFGAEEAVAWQRASEADSPIGWRTYLAEFPHGEHAAEAEAALARLAEQARQRDEAGQRRRRDDELWLQAAAIHNAASYLLYLDQFPDGVHITAARHALASLREEEAIREQDELNWRAARDRNCREGYETYLAAHPKGIHVLAARRALLRLREEASAGADTREIRDTTEEIENSGAAGPAEEPAVVPAGREVSNDSALRRRLLSAIRPAGEPNGRASGGPAAPAGRPSAGFEAPHASPVVRIMSPEQRPDPGARQFDITWPTPLTLAVVGFLGVIVLVLGNLIMAKMLGGVKLTGLLLSLLLTYGAALWYMINTKEVNLLSAAVASLTCVCADIVFFLLLIATSGR